MRRTPDASPFDTQLLGRDAAARCLAALGLQSVPRWHVEVALDNGHHTRFHLNIYAEEWGFAFHHARRSSWIRVTDAPFVHGRDDFGLLASTPDLATLNSFLAHLEMQFSIALRRSDAAIRTNIPGAARAVRAWLMHNAHAAEQSCGDEMHDDIRCTLARGHAGDHLFASTDGTLRWK